MIKVYTALLKEVSILQLRCLRQALLIQVLQGVYTGGGSLGTSVFTPACWSPEVVVTPYKT